jgi:hypothetical protein
LAGEIAALDAGDAAILHGQLRDLGAGDHLAALLAVAVD